MCHSWLRLFRAWVMTLALDHLAILGMGLGFVLLAGALLHAQSEE